MNDINEIQQYTTSSLPDWIGNGPDCLIKFPPIILRLDENNYMDVRKCFFGFENEEMELESRSSVEPGYPPREYDVYMSVYFNNTSKHVGGEYNYFNNPIYNLRTGGFISQIFDMPKHINSITPYGTVFEEWHGCYIKQKYSINNAIQNISKIIEDTQNVLIRNNGTSYRYFPLNETKPIIEGGYINNLQNRDIQQYFSSLEIKPELQHRFYWLSVTQDSLYGTSANYGIPVIGHNRTNTIPIFETEKELDLFLTTGYGYENAINYGGKELWDDEYYTISKPLLQYLVKKIGGGSLQNILDNNLISKLPNKGTLGNSFNLIYINKYKTNTIEKKYIDIHYYIYGEREGYNDKFGLDVIMSCRIRNIENCKSIYFTSKQYIGERGFTYTALALNMDGKGERTISNLYKQSSKISVQGENIETVLGEYVYHQPKKELSFIAIDTNVPIVANKEEHNKFANGESVFILNEIQNNLSPEYKIKKETCEQLCQNIRDLMPNLQLGESADPINISELPAFLELYTN